MKYKAHDYQQYATDFIIGHPVSCLILDMGLGKTVITLTALWLLLFDYFEVRRILVIAPKRVAETTWPAEIKKWEHLYGMTFAVAMGTAEQRKEALLSGADVTIIGRDNVSWMTKNIFFDFDMVIIDELSSFQVPEGTEVQRPEKSKADGKTCGRAYRNTGKPQWTYGQKSESLIWGRGLEDISAATVTGSSFRIRGIVRSSFRINPRDGAEEKIYELDLRYQHFHEGR